MSKRVVIANPKIVEEIIWKISVAAEEEDLRTHDPEALAELESLFPPTTTLFDAVMSARARLYLAEELENSAELLKAWLEDTAGEVEADKTMGRDRALLRAMKALVVELRA